MSIHRIVQGLPNKGHIPSLLAYRLLSKSQDFLSSQILFFSSFVKSFYLNSSTILTLFSKKEKGRGFILAGVQSFLIQSREKKGNVMFQKLPNIQSGRLSLTPIQKSDLEDLWKIYSTLSIFGGHPTPPPKIRRPYASASGIFKGILIRKKTLLALRLDGKLIGVLEAFDYKKRSASVTIGYRLHEDVWNQGLASKALSLFCNYLTTACQLQTIHAFVLPENQPLKSLRKMTFACRGMWQKIGRGMEKSPSSTLA